MENILDIIAKRSSCRSYTEQKPDRETVLKLVTAGLQAPTARNEQEIHITAVGSSDPVLKEIEDEKNAGQAVNVNFYYDAPVVLFLSGKADFPWTGVDAGIAAATISLAAEGLGLGNLIIGCIKNAMRGSKKSYFAEKLGFPDGYEFEVAVAVGYKAKEKVPHETDPGKNSTVIL